ncbi:unnamed protein product [Tetraodon nigroviridis]|uniref:(spotted green pufferfish) hypothetical protein n=1 Tax=Tetraodon nigroviridis TaxID=99883 RepID=Q4SWA8_TETNG|nr:unnamed protein product [Tetraodon nigroviridis]
MAQGVWTVLDPLAVFAVDVVLGRLVYRPDTPVGDAAKLYWHFYRIDQSGVSGVMITLFLFVVLSLLSVTVLFIYVLRFHNDGRMLDVFQRLTAKDGDYFLPQDLEVSIQEMSYIIKKAEQWRGLDGGRPVWSLCKGVTSSSYSGAKCAFVRCIRRLSYTGSSDDLSPQGAIVLSQREEVAECCTFITRYHLTFHSSIPSIHVIT